MLKGILIGLLLLGFAWAYPPTRARMLLAAQPGLERMGPIGRKIVLPIQRYSTGQEVKFIVDQIVLAKTENKDIPDERTFQRWIRERIVTKNRGRDAWGHPYYIIRVSNTLTIGSIGQDGQRGTADDIRKTVRH